MIDARNYETVETLRSGQTVTVRAIRSEDGTLIREGFHDVGQHSLYLRFFKAAKAITDRELENFTKMELNGKKEQNAFQSAGSCAPRTPARISAARGVEFERNWYQRSNVPATRLSSATASS